MIEHRYINNFVKYRFLLVELIKKNLFVKYKGSSLGILWSFLNPILHTLILVLVFGFLFNDAMPFFAIYVLIGRLMYDFFSGGTTQAMNSIRAGSNIMKKVYVPKYIYVLSAIISELITLLMCMTLLVVLMILLGCPFNIVNLYLFVPIVLLFIFSIGCGMILAPAYVYFRDVKYLYGVFTHLLMYGCAIFFPITFIPTQYQFVFYLNPVYVAISGFREVIIYGTIQPLDQIIFLGACALAVVVVGVIIFYKTQDEFILKI
jgi:lipopolysaccharide transport system permease protein